MVATPENKIQAASTTMSASQLSDLIQQVPQILGHMTNKSRRALLSTNKQFRRQMHQTATSIRIQSVQDIPLLVIQQWSHLKVINVTGRLHFDARSLTEVAMADWPLLQSLNLRNTEMRWYAALGIELSPPQWTSPTLLCSWHLGRFCLQHNGHG